MTRLAPLAALLLVGCAAPLATPEPRLVTQVVKVPVAVACALSPGPEPAYADTPQALQGAADIFERVKLLLAGRAQRTGRMLELAAANAGCR